MTVPRRIAAAALVVVGLLVVAVTVLGLGSDDDGRAGGQSARVLRVVDGDTLRVRLDGRDERVRLALVDAPESSSLRFGHAEPCGAEATRRLRALVGGRTVVLTRPSSEDRDRYGRLVREVHVGSVSVDERLAAEGWAAPFTVPSGGGGAAANRRIAAAAADAERHRRGAWAACGGLGRRHR